MRRTALLPVLLLGVMALSCGDGGGRASPTAPTGQAATPTAAPTKAAPLPAGLANAATHQNVPTYDGTGQAVHPDIAFFPDGWHGYKYWLAMTPYFYDSDSRENPSVVVSDDGVSWTVPPGLTNPLVPAPACDHNSDPDIVHNPRSEELYLYYTEQQRSPQCGAVNENHLRVLRSSDGIQWSGPDTVMSWDLDKDPLYLSPAVVYRKGAFEMWLTTGEAVVHMTSKDGVKWSPAKPVKIDGAPWHLDVAYVESRSEYWMLFVDSPVAEARLRLATSKDGLDWTVHPDPVLSPGADWDSERIYRSTFLYDAGDLFRVWYSAKSGDGQWHVGYTEKATR